MILDKWTLLALVAPTAAARHRLATRWAAAAARQPALVDDVIRMAGILSQRPRTFSQGVEVAGAVDPIALAIQEGRRELGIEILAAMQITPFELREITEINQDAD